MHDHREKEPGLALALHYNRHALMGALRSTHTGLGRAQACGLSRVFMGFMRAARHAYRIGALGHAAVQGIWWERGPQVLQSVCALMCASIGEGGQRSSGSLLQHGAVACHEPMDKLWTL